MREPLAGGAAPIRRRLEGVKDVLVKEMGERPMADVVQETRDPQRFDDEPLGRNRLASFGERGS